MIYLALVMGGLGLWLLVTIAAAMTEIERSIAVLTLTVGQIASFYERWETATERDEPLELR